jgi:hypothetical protein
MIEVVKHCYEWTFTHSSLTDISHYEYVNDDDYLDLVVQFEDSDGWVDSGSGSATLTGEFYNGTPIEGSDTICVVP